MSAPVIAKISQFLLYLILQSTGLYSENSFKETATDFLSPIKMGNENSCPHTFLLFKYMLTCSNTVFLFRKKPSNSIYQLI